MKSLCVAGLHDTVKQLDWLVANAGRYDLVIIGGDLLDLGSALDFDVQIVVVEKYLHRIRRHAPLLVSITNPERFGISRITVRSSGGRRISRLFFEARARHPYLDKL